MNYIYDAFISFGVDSSSPHPLSLYWNKQLEIYAKHQFLKLKKVIEIWNDIREMIFHFCVNCQNLYFPLRDDFKTNI